jgi:hypothetical protein
MLMEPEKTFLYGMGNKIEGCYRMLYVVVVEVSESLDIMFLCKSYHDRIHGEDCTLYTIYGEDVI